MIQKCIQLTDRNNKWLKLKKEQLGLSESDILRRIIDEKIEEESSRTTE